MNLLPLACPFCGAAGGTDVFLFVFGVFLLGLGGTVLMFVWSWLRGDFRDPEARRRVLEVEEPENDRSQTR